MKSLTIEFLKRTELFGDLDGDVLELLASHALEQKLERGEVLFLAGEPAAGLYVITEGSVRAFRRARGHDDCRGAGLR